MPSRQELIRRRRRTGLIGRQGEQAVFREALQQPPGEASQFLFHIHGPAGVGKSTLVRQLEAAARDAGALTAYLDESTADVVEALESVNAQFSQRGVDLKGFGKTLSTYRQRRHEAGASAEPAATTLESGGTGPGIPAQGPSPSSVIGSQLALAGLGTIPGVGPFTSVLDPNQVAAGADRFKALLSARLRNHEDVELVTAPLQVLTPVFLRGLTDAAERHRWVVLFFDTYEHTGPMLDTWLRDVLVSDRYGPLPANVLVVLAGQSRLDPPCWGDWLDLVTDLPLAVFTETEARQLLTEKGVTDEKVIEVVLGLSGGLPVLVSMLAEGRPSSVAEVGDPSGTAVERFLKWETNSVRRAAALACALPLEIDEDTYRSVVDEEAKEEFPWLRSRPFFIHRAGRGQYHDVVRSSMLRLQRQQSPSRWAEQHGRLAEVFRQRRVRLGLEDGPVFERWKDDQWRSFRLHETYHRLCAAPRTALPDALRELLDAQDHHGTTLRRWVQNLVQAGQDADAAAVREWGRDLLAALEEPLPGVAALTLLLSRADLDSRGRCLAYLLRSLAHLSHNDIDQALADCTTAIETEPLPRAFRFRGETYRRAGRLDEALADLDQAIEREPDVVWALRSRGQTQRVMGRYEGALADFDRAVALDPSGMHFAQRAETLRRADRLEQALADYNRALALDQGIVWAWEYRGLTLLHLKRYEEALSDFDHALAASPDHAWNVTVRAETRRRMGLFDGALADLDHALEIDPVNAWALAVRGKTHQSMERLDEALAEFDRALALDADYVWALSQRGQTFGLLDRHEEALADFGRALALRPDDAWALGQRGKSLRGLGRLPESLADLDRALALEPDNAWILRERGLTRQDLGRDDEALTDYDHAIALEPDHAWTLRQRGFVRQDLGRDDEALTDYDHAVALEPDHAWTLRQRGRARRLVQRYDEALADLDRAVALDPASTSAIANRGLVHRVSGRHEEALADYDRALALDPEDGWVFYEKAVALFALGRPEYEDCLRRAVELCSAAPAEGEAPSVPDTGNLVLAHCLATRWTEADEFLTVFLGLGPTPGDRRELSTVLETLRPVVPGSDDHLTALRRRLEDDH
ncbi:tetratricopeptide repeat protein [Streptomyces sp. HUAS MG91]|uniref:Tetratricopeptide repeat protein n=1 Tax=Streptomyces tabacisoli TaxID=3156398 RepID=A0AAU8IRY4_9ACTN